MTPDRFTPLILALLFAPLLQGLINKVKAFYAGRKGAPLLQAYYDLAKLFRKTPVYSGTASWIFAFGPAVSLASVAAAFCFVPMGGYGPLISFPGDFVLMSFFLALARFATIAAALDTGSSFEGMGASREAVFSALTEPVFFLSMAAAARMAGTYELGSMLPVPGIAGGIAAKTAPVAVLVFVAMGVIVLAENARIPVDDPNTHLELTMIHEVMVLDHSGPDFGYILYGAALKLWLFAAIAVGLVLPAAGNPVIDLFAGLAAMGCAGIAIGSIESVMARLRLLKAPQLIAGAGMLALLALILTMR